MVVGDSFASLDPDYTLGVTTAGLGALTLGQCLEDSGVRGGFSRHFHRRLAETYAVPWLMATGESFDWSADGAPPSAEDRDAEQGWAAAAAGRAFRAYFERVVACAALDPVLYRAFLEVSHMTKPSSSLLDPRLALRVLRATLLR